MSVPDHVHELIQKYLDSLATEAELAELEDLLAADPDVASAFAEAARLHSGLQDYFKKQYKIDQVAALLDAPETPVAPATGLPEGRVVEPGQPGAPAEAPLPVGSAYVPIYARLEKARRSRHATRAEPVAGRWKRVAAVAVLVMLGLTLWSLRSPGVERARLISGRVVVAGRAVSRVPENRTFEVAGKEAAVIELRGGARIELAAATRAAIRREAGRAVVQLESGGGNFRVSPGQSPFLVETPLGVVTTGDGRFSLDLITTPPDDFAPTEPLPMPRLVVVVAQGSVTVEHAGKSITLSAGQEQVFL